LWTAGVEAPPLATAVAKATGAQQDRAGRIIVNKDLTIPGHPDILVTGDMMSLDKLPGSPRSPVLSVTRSRCSAMVMSVCRHHWVDRASDRRRDP